MERTWIGPYRVVRRLGEGGMGAVYLVERDGRTYALKVVLPSLADDDTWLRFQRETTLLRELQHPGIVRWVEAGDADGTPYVVMEAVEGGSLDEQLARHGPLPIEQTLGIGVRLAEALEYAHERGIVHRDLKPANVLLAADGPRLSDFGLAALLDGPSRLTRSGDVLGSPAYMAPEQAEGRRRDQGPHTDVYGLGAVLYHMLTGQPPFAHAQVLQVLRQVSQQRPTPPSRLRPELPLALERLVLDCLAKDPAARPDSAAVVGRALARLRADRSRAAASVPRARTGPVVAAGVVGVGLTVAATLIASAGRTLAPPAPSASPSASPGASPSASPGAPSLAREQELRDLLDAGRFAEAEALARRALEEHPDSAMLWRALAVALAQQQRLGEALEAAVRATDLAPQDSQTWSVRASVEAASGQVEPALVSVERAIALDPDDPRPWVHKGTALAQLRRYEEAAVAYDRAIALDPDAPYVKANRATVLAHLGRLEAALVDLDGALRALPGDRPSALLRAQLLARLGRQAEAIEQLRAILAGAPHRLAAGLLAELLLDAGRRAEAREVVAAALAMDSRDARLWRLAALAAEEAAETERLLGKAIELDPTFGDAWRERGVLRAEAGRLDAALRDLDRAVPLLADDPIVYFNRGLVRRSAGRLELALDDLRAAIARGSDNGDLYLHAAQLCHELGNLDEALTLVDEGLRRRPENAAARALREEIVAARQAR